MEGKRGGRAVVEREEQKQTEKQRCKERRREREMEEETEESREEVRRESVVQDKMTMMMTKTRRERREDYDMAEWRALEGMEGKENCPCVRMRA